MAIARGQTDRFGNPIPANPGYKVFVNSDGSVLQQRELITLDSTITATDDDATGATSLSAVPSAIVPNSGSAAGRFFLPVVIDDSNFTTATSATYSKTWTSGLYREVRVTIVTTVASATLTVTMAGLTGAYKSNWATTDGTLMLPSTHADWTLPLGTAGGFASFIVDARNGQARSITGTFMQNGTPFYTIQFAGNNADTTHDITGISISMSSAATFNITVLGIPA